jgi:hypothetical protein
MNGVKSKERSAKAHQFCQQVSPEEAQPEALSEKTRC